MTSRGPLFVVILLLLSGPDELGCPAPFPSSQHHHQDHLCLLFEQRPVQVPFLPLSSRHPCRCSSRCLLCHCVARHTMMILRGCLECAVAAQLSFGAPTRASPFQTQILGRLTFHCIGEGAIDPFLGDGQTGGSWWVPSTGLESFSEMSGCGPALNSTEVVANTNICHCPHLHFKVCDWTHTARSPLARLHPENVSESEAKLARALFTACCASRRCPATQLDVMSPPPKVVQGCSSQFVDLIYQ